MRGPYSDRLIVMKFMFSRSSLLCIFALLIASANAAEIVVQNAWVRATAPGTTTAAVYMDLTSPSDAALVSVTSTAAQSAELHETRVEGGVMKMRPVARVPLPARQVVRIAPGGLHVMLTGMKQPLKAGERVPVVLTVEGPTGRQQVSTQAIVRPAASAPATDHKH